MGIHYNYKAKTLRNPEPILPEGFTENYIDKAFEEIKKEQETTED